MLLKCVQRVHNFHRVHNFVKSIFQSNNLQTRLYRPRFNDTDARQRHNIFERIDNFDKQFAYKQFLKNVTN